jgi:hypothetical protein
MLIIAMVIRIILRTRNIRKITIRIVRRRAIILTMIIITIIILNLTRIGPVINP